MTICGGVGGPAQPNRLVIYREGAPQAYEVRQSGRIPAFPGRDWRNGAADASKMRRFYFNRTTDVSGTSGTGAVVEGVVFSDGRVALRWITGAAPSSTCIYDSIEDAIGIHGHEGSTELVWLDGG